jgi:hypothetical protein
MRPVGGVLRSTMNIHAWGVAFDPSMSLDLFFLHV